MPRMFSAGQGAVLRRRHVHRRPAQGRGHRPRAGPAGHHVVMQRQGQRAPRDAGRAEGQRAAPGGRGLMIGDEHIQQHQEGPAGGPGPALRAETARTWASPCTAPFILGLPGETRETIQETIRYAREVNPHTIQVSVAAPYPGTGPVPQGHGERAGFLRTTTGHAGQRGGTQAERAVVSAPGAHRDPGIRRRLLQNGSTSAPGSWPRCRPRLMRRPDMARRPAARGRRVRPLPAPRRARTPAAQ